jgi:hypothetical protein
MVQGKHLDDQTRYLIYTITVVEKMTANVLHRILFQHKTSACSLNHLERLQSFLHKASDEEIADFLVGRSKDRCRKRRFDAIDDRLIEDLNTRFKDSRDATLAQLYQAHTGREKPSGSTIRRSLKVSRVTKKKYNRQSLLACPIEKLEHMKIMEPFPPYVIQNIDETSCNKNKYLATHGRCKSGEDLIGTSGPLMGTLILLLPHILLSVSRCGEYILMPSTTSALKILCP